MKLYVWDNVLQDYTYGIIFALAPDIATARKIVTEYDSSPLVAKAIESKPSVYEKGTVARVVHGGA